MVFWKTLASGIIRDVVRPEVEALTVSLVGKLADAVLQVDKAIQRADAAVAEVQALRKQMSALMALDVGFKDAGKVILLTRIGDQDRVKIIDVKPSLTPLEYKALVDRLQAEYGVVAPTWVDKPVGMDDVLVGVTPLRRGVRSK